MEKEKLDLIDKNNRVIINELYLGFLRDNPKTAQRKIAEVLDVSLEKAGEIIALSHTPHSVFKSNHTHNEPTMTNA